MIKVIQSEKSWIESNAIEQLKKMAALKGILLTVGFPDLHVGKTPVGASYVTKEIIYPHLIGNDIGCGIGLFATEIVKKKFKIDKVYQKLSSLNELEEVDIHHKIQDVDLPFKDKLGTIGSGNHFAEFQEVAEVFQKDALNQIGINTSEIYLLVHSGSRTYGEAILDEFIRKYSCQNGLTKDSLGFQEYLQAHNKAVEFATLNRELIAYRILKMVQAKAIRKLLDSCHNGISHKEINGEECYIHRKGAAPSDMGYCVIAGSRGSKSYLVKPKDNLVDYAFSLAHGAGRKWARVGCKEKLEKIYSKKDIRRNNHSVNLICKDKNVIFEEAPEAYKNIERVIEDMLRENMIELVASFNPLLTYKV